MGLRVIERDENYVKSQLADAVKVEYETKNHAKFHVTFTKAPGRPVDMYTGSDASGRRSFYFTPIDLRESAQFFNDLADELDRRSKA